METFSRDFHPTDLFACAANPPVTIICACVEHLCGAGPGVTVVWPSPPPSL